MTTLGVREPAVAGAVPLARLFMTAALVSASACAGCSSRSTSEQVPKADAAASFTGGRTFDGQYPIKALCTTGMVADMVRQVGNRHVEVIELEETADEVAEESSAGGDEVAVAVTVAVDGQRAAAGESAQEPAPSNEPAATGEPLVAIDQLMGAGVDPHLYKPSPGDNSRLSQADVIFYSGLHLEGKMSDLLEGMGRKKPALAITSQIDHDRLLSVGPNVYDPHLWTDAALWSQTAVAVALLLSEFDPTHADEYSRNAARYQAELTRLDSYCREQAARIPDGRDVLVTAHDAFQYLGRAYGLEVRSIQGISTESEAGVKEINDLVEFIADRKIKAVFVETTVSDRNVQALVEGCRANGHDIVIGGKLYSDAMGDEGTAEGTYVGMTRHNIDTIVAALE